MRPFGLMEQDQGGDPNGDGPNGDSSHPEYAVSIHLFPAFCETELNPHVSAHFRMSYGCLMVPFGKM